MIYDATELRETLVRQEVDAVRMQALAEAMCARIEALEAFVEEVRDLKPEVFTSRSRDPQDDTPDMIEHGYLVDLQYEAERLIGKNVKRNLASFGRVA